MTKVTIIFKTVRTTPTVTAITKMTTAMTRVNPTEDDNSGQKLQHQCFYAPPQKSGEVLCYTLRTFECLSVRPSAVDHSCPLHNFATVGDNFTKLGTNIKHDQTTCRD